MKNKFLEEKYNLAKNPFTGYRATREDLIFWVNREKEEENWKKAIQEALNNPSNHYIVFIIGDYGMGKSLSLYRIEEICKEYKVFPVTFTFLGEERVKNPGINFIQRIFKFVDFTKLKSNEKNIEKLSLISNEVANIFHKIFFGDNETKRLALAFLHGQFIPNKSEMKQLGIIRKISDIEIAKEYLMGFLYLLKMAGYHTLVLLVDEFEYLFSLVPKTQRDIYFALIRGLYDLPTKINGESIANMLFFLSISKEEYRKIEEKLVIGGPVIPFKRRVYSANELYPLKKKDVEKLIELRLKYNRVKKCFEEDPLIPYDRDFVNFIWETTGGRPRDIIYKCGQILDAGIKYKVPKLDKEFAIKALKERGILA